MEMNSAKKCFLAFLFLTILVFPAHAAGDWTSKWNYTTDGGIMAVAIDDIDNDGFPEVVAATTASTLCSGGAICTSSWLYVLDKDGNPRWDKGSSVFGAGKINSLLISDLEGDGKKEIIVGCGSYIHFFDGAGNAGQKIHLESKFEIMTILIADVNNDKINELVIAGPTANQGNVYVYNSKRQRLFYTPDTQQRITAFYAGDLNNDGLYEYVTGTTGKWDTDPAFIYGYNSEGVLLWSYKITQGGVMSLGALDLDGDKISEVLAGGKGYVYAFDAAGALKKSINLTGANVDTLVTYDIDKNGESEILAAGNFLYLLDKNLVKKWKSDSIFSETNKIKFYDLNNDGLAEILLAANGLYILDKEGKQTDAIFPQSNSVKDFVLSDLNYDDYPEIILGLYGSSIGRVHAMNSLRMAKATNADRTYKKASAMLNSGNLTGAEELAREAQKQFNDLADKQGAANAKELLTRIVAAQSASEGTKNQADGYYTKAADAYTSGDMAAALTNAKIARAKYYQINDAENLKRCDNIITPATERLTSEAAMSLSKAQSSYDGGQFNDAVSHANRSAELFELLNDAGNKQKSLALLEQAHNAGGVNLNATSEAKPLFPDLDSGTQNMLLFGAIGLALLILIVYLASVVKKRRSVPKLSLVLAEDNPKESILDELDKDEKVRGKKRPRKEEGVDEKPLEEKKKADAWIGVRNVEHEKEGEPNHVKTPLSGLKEKKRLEKITKDGFRGMGVSLAHLGVRKTPDMKKAEEEDISD